jgi:hypothetical protein
MADDTLRAALVDLVRAASTQGITVFLGGGYGLYLKQIHLTSTQQRTFLPVEAWPRPRGTPDLDIFLPTEIVVDLKHMVRLRKILDELDYKPVPTAKFMHFEKEVPQGRVRVELLTGPIGSELLEKVRLQKLPQVRPKGEVELHAYLHEEAVALDVGPLVIAVSHDVTVLIPNAFSFLLMKLHACHDRLDDEDKQLGRHHALDVYRVLAMLSEPEVELIRRLHLEHRDNAAVRRAAEIAAEIFGHITSRGVLRMREHALASEAMQIEQALEMLHDLFRDAGS